MNPSERRFSPSFAWLLGGALAIALLFGCVLLTAVGFYLRSAGDGAARSETAAQTIALPAPTPHPQVIVQPPPDGVDYESAVLMNIYDRVNPSVVNITVFLRGDKIHDQGVVTGLDPEKYYEASGGSGFVWDRTGHIVTNNHVIEGADRVAVKFSGGIVTLAEVVGADVDSDLAVLRIDSENFELTPIEHGNLDQVQVGQRVAAIGNPFGLEGTLTSGIVSAIGRSIPARASFSIPASIQTDAPINPGNSGGPLLNERGEVIGVNAQIRSEERANSGVGFAIPISIVERVVPSLIEKGRYDHPYMGVSGATFSPICAEEQGIDETLRGALVLEVLRGTPAARAGLQGGDAPSDTLYPEICPAYRDGDLITAINEQAVTGFDDVLSFLQRFTSPGDTVTLTVLRAGESRQIDLTLAARPRE